MKDNPREWEPINPKDCPNELYKRMREDRQQEKIEMYAYFDAKFQSVIMSKKKEVKIIIHNSLNTLAIAAVFILFLIIKGC